MIQRVQKASEDYKEIDDFLEENGIRSFLLVCNHSISYLNINSYFENLERRTGIKALKFQNFKPNPLYESVLEGIRAFRENGCQGIIAVGGGSAMDVAKCIRLYSSCDIRMLAVPTTAGSGSEATKYAVIYYKDEKQSVTHDSMIPDTVIMDGSVLQSLPLYQKKSAVLDALCHCIESFWSVNSTKESQKYSAAAIEMILNNRERYLADDSSVNESMLYAAHLAGRAINVTQTTAGHAMCYKLTGLYGIAHGHAASLCVKELWPWMLQNTDRCADLRGKEYLQTVFEELARLFGCTDVMSGAVKFQMIVEEMNMYRPVIKGNLDILCSSVNPVRLKNNPVKLTKGDIDILYRRILAE